MAINQNSPPKGVFFGTRRPFVFYVCGGGEGIRYVIETNGGVITTSTHAAQIVIFNRDITPEILWPISVEERKVFEVVQRLGAVQPVLSSLWIYRSCREKELLERSEYTIQIGVYQIIPPSTIAVSTTPIPPVFEEFRPITPASVTAPNIPSTLGQHQPLFLSPSPQASHTQPACQVQTQLAVVPNAFPPAHPQSVTTGRQTNNSISSTLGGPRSSHQELESKRRERQWRTFYTRHHESVDFILREKGIDPKGWHNYPTRALKDKVSGSGMKGWAWVVEPVDPIV